MAKGNDFAVDSLVALGPSGQIWIINKGRMETLRLETGCKRCVTFVMSCSGIYKWDLIITKKPLKPQIKDTVSKKQTKELRH